jgi:glucose dehydrogenase
MGVPNMGGSVITSGGLAFIGAALDRKLRAYDLSNGHELWSALLPAVAAATPMTYISPKTGRQYVVIAAGGHYGLPGPSAGAVLAFSLPENVETVPRPVRVPTT